MTTEDGSTSSSGTETTSLSTLQQQVYDKAHDRYAARFNAAAHVIVVPSLVEHFDPIRDLTLRAYEPVVPTLYDDGYAQQLADLESRAETTKLFTALVNNQIVGSITYIGDANHELNCFADEAAAYIRYLAVDPSAQGVGAGRLLVQRCIDEADAEQRAKVGLHTLPTMAAAIGLYESLGFERSLANDGLTHVGYDGEAPAFLKVLRKETSD